MIIKSAKALKYMDSIFRQVPVRKPLLEGDLELELVMYYASRRPDLDPSLIFDGLQGRIYANDRQIKRFTCTWGLDKYKPRAEIIIKPLVPAAVKGDSGKAGDHG